MEPKEYYRPDGHIVRVALRFWEKVEKTKKCWIWTGSVSDFGHGCVRIQSRLRRARAVAWEWHNRCKVPKGLCVLHKCDNPPCVRPDHLFIGTKKDNTADMVSKGRGKLPPVNKGELPWGKLTWVQVRKIRKLYAEKKLSQYQLAAKFGVSQPLIGNITRCRIWKE